MQLRSRTDLLGQSSGSSDPPPSSIKLGRGPSLASKEAKAETRSKLTRDLEVEDWVDGEGGMGAKIRYPGRVGVKVPAAIWDKWKPTGYFGGEKIVKSALRDVPIYLLRFLRSNRIGEEMSVREDDDLDIPGRHFIIESVDKEGAFFLVTQFGQSDVAIAVKGYDAVCFQGHTRYRLAGEMESHTQYVSEMPRRMLANWVYTQKIPDPSGPGGSDATPSTERGTVVRYHTTLVSPSHCSYQMANLGLRDFQVALLP